MKKKLLVSILFSLGLLTPLASCSSGTSNSTPTPTPSTPVIPSDPSQEEDNTEKSQFDKDLENAIKRVQAVSASDYPSSSYNAVDTLKMTAIVDLNAASSSGEIREILNKFFNDLSKIKTNVEVNADTAYQSALTSAGSDLDSYRSTEVNNCSQEYQNNIHALIASAKVDISNCKNIDEINKVVNDCKNSIDDEIKKDSENKNLITAKTNAKADINSYKTLSDYEPNEQSAIADLISYYESIIDKAVSINLVSNAVKECKKALDQVKTSAQLEKEMANSQYLNFKQQILDQINNFVYKPGIFEDIDEQRIDSLIADALNTINSTLIPDTTADFNSAKRTIGITYSDLMREIDKIDSIVERAHRAEILDYFNSIDTSIYRNVIDPHTNTSDQSNVTNLIADAIRSLQNCYDVDSMDQLKESFDNDLANYKSDAELTKEEVKNRSDELLTSVRTLYESKHYSGNDKAIYEEEIDKLKAKFALAKDVVTVETAYNDFLQAMINVRTDEEKTDADRASARLAISNVNESDYTVGGEDLAKLLDLKREANRAIDASYTVSQIDSIMEKFNQDVDALYTISELSDYKTEMKAQWPSGDQRNTAGNFEAEYQRDFATLETNLHNHIDDALDVTEITGIVNNYQQDFRQMQLDNNNLRILRRTATESRSEVFTYEAYSLLDANLDKILYQERDDARDLAVDTIDNASDVTTINDAVDSYKSTIDQLLARDTNLRNLRTQVKNDLIEKINNDSIEDVDYTKISSLSQDDQDEIDRLKADTSNVIDLAETGPECYSAYNALKDQINFIILRKDNHDYVSNYTDSTIAGDQYFAPWLVSYKALIENRIDAATTFTEVVEIRCEFDLLTAAALDIINNRRSEYTQLVNDYVPSDPDDLNSYNELVDQTDTDYNQLKQDLANSKQTALDAISSYVPNDNNYILDLDAIYDRYQTDVTSFINLYRELKELKAYKASACNDVDSYTETNYPTEYAEILALPSSDPLYHYASDIEHVKDVCKNNINQCTDKANVDLQIPVLREDIRQIIEGYILDKAKNSAILTLASYTSNDSTNFARFYNNNSYPVFINAFDSIINDARTNINDATDDTSINNLVDENKNRIDELVSSFLSLVNLGYDMTVSDISTLTTNIASDLSNKKDQKIAALDPSSPTLSDDTTEINGVYNRLSPMLASSTSIKEINDLVTSFISFLNSK